MTDTSPFTPRTVKTIFLIAGAVWLAGCQPVRMHYPEPTAQGLAALPSMEQLQEQEATADSAGEIQQLIQHYEATPTAAAKTRAASLYLLLGANYSASKSQQKAFYRMAAEKAVDAMMQDNPFKDAIAMGETVPQAAASLPADLYEPLFLWATSVFYHFRDVASVPEKIIRKNRLRSAAEAIEVIINKDPAWYGGSLQFSLGIYYLSLPEFAGGDRDKAVNLINEAVAMSDTRLLPRWGRAKYLAVATGNVRQFTRDLEWVLDQDLADMEGPVIWNRYFIEDSKRLLASKDSFFNLELP